MGPALEGFTVGSGRTCGSLPHSRMKTSICHGPLASGSFFRKGMTRRFRNISLDRRLLLVYLERIPPPLDSGSHGPARVHEAENNNVQTDI